MGESESSVIKADTTRLIALCLSIVGGFSALVAFLFFGDDVTSWVIVVTVGGVIAFFSMESILAWHGEYKKVPLAYASMIIAPVTTVTLMSYAAESDLGVALNASFLTLIFVVFPWFIQFTVFPTRTILRKAGGLRESGNLRDGIVGCSVSMHVSQRYGSPVIENAIEMGIRDMPGYSGVWTFETRTRDALAYSVARANDLTVLYRFRDGLVQALCIPIDGVVSRFEKAADYAKSLEYALVQINGFAEPNKNDWEVLSDELRKAYDGYGSPKHRVLTAKNLARIALLCGVAGAVATAVNYRQTLYDALAEDRVNTALSSIAYLIVIAGGAYGTYAFFRKRIRNHQEEKGPR